MTRSYGKFLALTLVGVTGFAIAADNGTDIKISGWVIDSACAYTKGLDKPIGVACAKACAKNGSPLVILRDDGTIFLPIDSKTPSSSQNSKLVPFAGEHVTVTARTMFATLRMPWSSTRSPGSASGQNPTAVRHS